MLSASSHHQQGIDNFLKGRYQEAHQNFTIAATQENHLFSWLWLYHLAIRDWACLHIALAELENYKKFITPHIDNLLKNASRADEYFIIGVILYKEPYFNRVNPHLEKTCYLLAAVPPQPFAPALNSLGFLYQEHPDAVLYYTRAAEMGYALAECNVGIMYKNGKNGLVRDPTKAKQFFERAIAQNYAPANLSLSTLYRDNLIVSENNVERAYTLLKTAADQGFSDGEGALATEYPNETDPAKLRIAQDYLTRAANRRDASEPHGSAAAQFALACRYLKGKATTPEGESPGHSAFTLLTAAANQDFPQAAYKLAIEYYLNGMAGVTDKNIPQAISLLKKAAAKKFPFAYYNLAILYQEGRRPHLQQDLKLAYDYFQKAITYSDAQELQKLATTKLERLIALIKKAYEEDVDSNHARHLAYYLGYCYEKHFSDTRGLKNAYKLYIQAAEANNLDAIYTLGERFEQGAPLAQNEEPNPETRKILAVKWYRKAADQKHVEAMVKLASCLLEGKGTVRDSEQAKALLNEAASLKSANAKTLLEKLTQDEKSHAQKRIKLSSYEEGINNVLKSNFKTALENFSQVSPDDEDYLFALLWKCYLIIDPHFCLLAPNSDYINTFILPNKAKFLSKALVATRADQQFIIGRIVYGYTTLQCENPALTELFCYMAAEQNFAPALTEMGVKTFLKGDSLTAETYFIKAASQNYLFAKCSLGQLYQNGSDVIPKNPLKALQLFQEVSDQNNALGQYLLGRFYLKYNNNTQRYIERGITLLTAAATEGLCSAQVSLGDWYSTRDIAKAKEWYQKAINLGDTNAKTKLEKLNQQRQGRHSSKKLDTRRSLNKKS